jgi:hypothetical protein
MPEDRIMKGVNYMGAIKAKYLFEYINGGEKQYTEIEITEAFKSLKAKGKIKWSGDGAPLPSQIIKKKA